MANSIASNSNLVNNSLKDIKDTATKDVPKDFNKDLKEVKETTRDTLHDASSTLRDTVGNIASNARETTGNLTTTLRDATKNIPSADEVTGRAREILGNTQEIAGRAYDRSADWVQSNRNGLLGGLAIAALAGTIGYFIGRNTGSSLEDLTS